MIENTRLIRETHSSDSLFHFMKKPEFLTYALQKKRLSPRYCKEMIEYLGIKYDEKEIKSVAILQKCFCDIRLHSIMQPLEVRPIGENLEQSRFLTHTDFYGEYGLAFSKKWGIERNLEPVHYVNISSDEVKTFKSAFEKAASVDEIDETIVDQIINRLCYIKPLTGIMERIEDGNEIKYEKNFHDEREWRFIPRQNDLDRHNKERLFFNDKLLVDVNAISNRLQDDEYEQLSLRFEFGDIRYILVPDYAAREKIIQYMADELVISDAESGDKYVREKLISKILVLEDLKGDC